MRSRHPSLVDESPSSLFAIIRDVLFADWLLLGQLVVYPGKWSHEAEIDVAINQPEQVICRNLLFQAEAIK